MTQTQSELKIFKVVWLVCIIVSTIIIILSFVLQQMKFGVSYPLGWDQPIYVFQANQIAKIGIVPWILSVKSFDLYWALPAYLGMLVNGAGASLITIEIVQTCLLAFLFSVLTYKITSSYIVASATVVLYPFLNNSVQLFVLPRESFALVLMLGMMILIEHLLKPLNLRSLKTWFFIIATLTLFLWNITNAVFFTLILFSFCIFVRKRVAIINSLILVAIGTILSISLFYIVFGQYFYEVTYWPSLMPTPIFYTSEFVRWTGGSLPLVALSISGFICLLLLVKRYNKTQAIIAFIWGGLALALFTAGFLISSAVNMWYVYSFRSLLLFPVQLYVPICLGLVVFGAEKIVRRFAFAKQ